MEKPKPIERIYPEQRGPLADFHTWDAHRQTLDKVYDLHDKLNGFMHQSNVGQKATLPAGGPSNTTITGIPVKGTSPANGHTIRYNSATGQFEFGV
jgi:hypothetical protein